ncbi:MAG: hypothetical protein ACQESR_20825 [Planctomycetota bacterium]
MNKHPSSGLARTKSWPRPTAACLGCMGYLSQVLVLLAAAADWESWSWVS